jgi:hypothetical protein
MVSRWVGPSEVKLWFATGGTYIPPEIGRASERVSVIPYGGQLPAGLGRDSTIRIDFAVPERALNKGGEGLMIFQPSTNIPIYNVAIHIPVTLDVEDVLRNRGT